MKVIEEVEKKIRRRSLNEKIRIAAPYWLIPGIKFYVHARRFSTSEPT